MTFITLDTRLPPHRHLYALCAWVSPSPRVRCRKASVTYPVSIPGVLLTYLARGGIWSPGVSGSVVLELEVASQAEALYRAK